jgi:hypothetical protein
MTSIAKTDGSVVSFDFREQESKGTQRLFKLSGPWLEVLEKGYTTIIRCMLKFYFKKLNF